MMGLITIDVVEGKEVLKPPRSPCSCFYLSSSYAAPWSWLEPVQRLVTQGQTNSMQVKVAPAPGLGPRKNWNLNEIQTKYYILDGVLAKTKKILFVKCFFNRAWKGDRSSCGTLERGCGKLRQNENVGRNNKLHLSISLARVVNLIVASQFCIGNLNFKLKCQMISF